MQRQHTVKDIVKIKGIGLHSGVDVELNILPAAENTGITFKRIDLKDSAEIKGIYTNVGDTRNSTTLVKDGVIVATVEHLMCALYMAGVDNAHIEINNQETPILDSSAKPFYDAIKKVGLKEQSAERRFLEIKKEISFTDERGNTVSLKPHSELKIDFEIFFPSPIVGNQRFNNVINDSVFNNEIAFCRTFAEKSQIDGLRAMGLIKGGSLENAVVLDGEKVLNPEGFRVEKECVNHKVLDAIGDLYTSGYRILGELKATKTGHCHTNELLKKMFADNTNYTII